MRRCLFTVLLLPVVWSSCADPLEVEKRVPNRPPQTILSGGPQEFAATSYRVQLSWWGSDADGTIDHFDFIMVDHPAVVDSIDASFVIEVPEVADPRWRGTHATDSLFVTLADTLRLEPQGGPPAHVLRDPFERWHTFFVRAVDNEGLPDPTPDHLSFNAVNLAPTVTLRSPVSPGLQFTSPPAVTLFWDGEDPVGDGTVTEPVASRWVLISSGVSLGGGFASWPESLYVLPARFAWSPWHAWGAPDSLGIRAALSGMAQVGHGPQSGYYIFAVQALDEAGAITPVFDTAARGKNNAVLLRVSGSAGPHLLVTEAFLGAYSFVGAAAPIQLNAAVGQPILFRWSADASHYGGVMAGYRFGWNIRNLQDDAEWSSWSLSDRGAPLHSIPYGVERFYLQARDNAGNVTSCVFELTSHEVTRERDILWVDDTASDNAFDEALEDSLWLQVFDAIATTHGLTFFPETDAYDAGFRRFTPPTIDHAFRYKAIVWSVRNGPQGSSGLRTLAQFFDPYAARNRNRNVVFNYLSTYLAQGGKLWINGFRPALQLWPPERDVERPQDPVNVTNWDDPINPHPLVDSVGTTSFLYQMRVEMFDVGTATGAARSTSQHFCRGLRRTLPPVAEQQVFASSQDVGHSHELQIALADVENKFADVQLETNSSAEHRHLVRFTPALLQALLAGKAVHITSEESPLPESHVHAFDVQDRTGFWGAPLLFTGGNWPSSPGTSGRLNVEILNMPGAMAVQRVPLVPLEGIATVVYTYVSGVPATAGFVYPQTADGQPVFVLGKTTPSDASFSRAFCGFEPHLLFHISHRQLAEFVLVRMFGLGSGAGTQ